MIPLEDILQKAAADAHALSLEELERILSADEKDAERIFAAAYSLKVRCCGRKVAFRGLIEAGNVCVKDCLYCGIRRSNGKVARYRMDVEEIVRTAEVAHRLGYGSIVIQSGEIESAANSDFIEEVLLALRPLDLGITLSLGEQTEDVFRRWKDAGASRYLLRIETSSPRLYSALHPADHSWRRRVECLHALRRCGYQVGTGVMCALPGQTMADLARDVAFYAEVDADMIGMGPYIPHPDTPLGKDIVLDAADKARRLFLALKLIAATRLYLHDVNIAASTALQALAEDGRERGILAGANVIMPNVTDTCHRAEYALYAGKPGFDETAAAPRLAESLRAIGEEMEEGRGDSRHWANNVQNVESQGRR